MAEIEPQPVGCDQYALLRHRAAEPRGQRRVQQMGGAMIGANLRAPFSVDRQMHAVADLDRTRLDRGAMLVDPPERLGRVADRRLQSNVAGDGDLKNTRLNSST